MQILKAYIIFSLSFFTHAQDQFCESASNLCTIDGLISQSQIVDQERLALCEEQTACANLSFSQTAEIYKAINHAKKMAKNQLAVVSQYTNTCMALPNSRDLDDVKLSSTIVTENRSECPKNQVSLFQSEVLSEEYLSELTPSFAVFDLGNQAKFCHDYYEAINKKNDIELEALSQIISSDKDLDSLCLKYIYSKRLSKANVIIDSLPIDVQDEQAQLMRKTVIAWLEEKLRLKKISLDKITSDLETNPADIRDEMDTRVQQYYEAIENEDMVFPLLKREDYVDLGESSGINFYPGERESFIEEWNTNLSNSSIYKSSDIRRHERSMSPNRSATALNMELRNKREASSINLKYERLTGKVCNTNSDVMKCEVEFNGFGPSGDFLHAKENLFTGPYSYIFTSREMLKKTNILAKGGELDHYSCSIRTGKCGLSGEDPIGFSEISSAVISQELSRLEKETISEINRIEDEINKFKSENFNNPSSLERLDLKNKLMDLARKKDTPASDYLLMKHPELSGMVCSSLEKVSKEKQNNEKLLTALNWGSIALSLTPLFTPVLSFAARGLAQATNVASKVSLIQRPMSGMTSGLQKVGGSRLSQLSASRLGAAGMLGFSAASSLEYANSEAELDSVTSYYHNLMLQPNQNGFDSTYFTADVLNAQKDFERARIELVGTLSLGAAVATPFMKSFITGKVSGARLKNATSHYTVEEYSKNAAVLRAATNFLKSKKIEQNPEHVRKLVEFLSQRNSKGSKMSLDDLYRFVDSLS